ncbi:hypothetical protein TKK_0016190 [Trichogramma kaykai]|uniref:Ig-like domain-containing protein n=1 Tax=Trichogramma kaykai TaxID=54128 RepID=A0ABD2W760_9HYME
MGRSLSWAWLVLLLVSNCVAESNWGECVPACKCIWVSGKRMAECKQQNLTSVPKGLKSFQHLDLTGNNIAQLPDQAFTRVELDNLQKLVLRDCKINYVSSEAFKGLLIVIEIDLSQNHIRQLKPGTFNDTVRLRVLLLNQNRLEKLEDAMFHNLAYLQKVELRDNQLKTIGPTSFRQLRSLHTLAFDGNNLTTLSMQSFEDLGKLASLELGRNPWNCDCKLRSFRDWAIQQNAYSRPTVCASPATIAGKAWDELASEDFACPPDIDQLGWRQTPSGQAELWCRATGEPQAQPTWSLHDRVFLNGSRRPAMGGDQGHVGRSPYMLYQRDGWANLSITDPSGADRGEYVCQASNAAGSVAANLSLSADLLLNGPSTTRRGLSGLPLALGLGLAALIFLLAAMSLCFCYCKRRRRGPGPDKAQEAASLDHHGLGEQEKSLITAINPVTKPPRRYEAPSMTQHGTEMTELNRTLLDSDSVYGEYRAEREPGGGGGGGSGPLSSARRALLNADGSIGSVLGVLANGLRDQEHSRAELDPLLLSGSISSAMGHVVVPSRTATPHRQYPPDLLAFPGGRNASPTSQASTAPDHSRLLTPGSLNGTPASPLYAPLAFKTLPHPVRSSSATPYSMGQQFYPSMPRHGFVTIPRRPRAPSWSSPTPVSPTHADTLEPVYDNLGRRTTADGSSMLSLNKTSEPRMSMRGRPLPATPIPGIHPATLTLPRAPRSRKPAILMQQAHLNRSAPEGAPDWPGFSTGDSVPLARPKPIRATSPQSLVIQERPASPQPLTKLIADDSMEQNSERLSPVPRSIPSPAPATPPPPSSAISTSSPSTLTRKVPPRPPPKPKKKNNNGPLYEDEGEDGTEVSKSELCSN